MKNTIIIFLLFIFILLVAYYQQHKQKESFIPVINRMYRPHVRNAKVYLNDKMTTTSNYMTSLIRKTGLL